MNTYIWIEIGALWAIAIALAVYALNGAFYNDLGGHHD
jgi:hypothetical protein